MSPLGGSSAGSEPASRPIRLIAGGELGILAGMEPHLQSAPKLRYSAQLYLENILTTVGAVCQAPSAAQLDKLQLVESWYGLQACENVAGGLATSDQSG